MQKVTGIGGVFFRANDPKSLIDWYERNLGVDISKRTWVQESGQTVFSPFDAATDYFGKSTQQWMICFRVNDLSAMISQLEANNIQVFQKAEWNSEVGKFARIHDLEGNPVELWQPSAESATIGG
ncbi:glyoxalase [Amylibacter ulvae]|uniref:Glyoxalase n=1 Tax=Paramylibacter ulvae TaxID=1651968 RepID=A0ABQ3D5V0_9RHOB|nr:VOC family protein [Amylibacter ulvae]GHA60204.1 glyoxalase [Amylibacter ulvae]